MRQSPTPEDPELLSALSADLAVADYRAQALSWLWGDPAERARLRGALAPARLALEERSREAQGETPLAVLARLFLLGDPVSADALDLALPSLGSAGALALGLCRDTAAGLRAEVSLNPVELPDPGAKSPGAVAEWWVLSDLDDHLRGGPARHDHVMGVGGATRSLLALAPFGHAVTFPGLHAFDLGTGCGIVAMQLALVPGIERIVASDISERALSFARANARLNGLDGRIDFRLGDLFAPVAGERFDLILSNPPFVITPRHDADAPKYDYRDGGMTGDELARTVVRTAPAHLREGGELICLANWEVRWGSDGLSRVRSWIDDASSDAGVECAGWVIERDRVDPALYAETWARDGGARPGDPVFDALVDGSLRDFSERKVVAVGLGSIRLGRLGGSEAQDDAGIRAEQAPGAFTADDPGAALMWVWRAAIQTSRMSDEEVLSTRWLRSPRVREEREYPPGAEEPSAIRLITDSPIARREAVDPVLAGAIGVCDGELSLAQIAGALATLMELDEAHTAAVLVSCVRELVWQGMVAPAPR